ncbi:hypothetical protein ScPMuIL_015293 [Solemya velum]
MSSSSSIKYKKSSESIGFTTRVRQFWNNSIRSVSNSRKKTLRLSDIHHWDEPGFEIMLNKAIFLEKVVYENGPANGGHDDTEGVYSLHAEVRDIGGQLKETTEQLRTLLEPTTDTVLEKKLAPPLCTNMQKITEVRTGSQFVKYHWNDIYDHREIYMDETTFSRREARFYRLAAQKKKWLLENTEKFEDEEDYSILDMLLGEAW